MISDSEGLYLLIHPTGAKYWRIKYRVHKKEKRMALGVYPEVSLLKAREARFKIKQQLKNGHDPFLVKLEEQQTAAIKSAVTFRTIAEEWHANSAGQWDPRYAATVLHRLKKYVFDEIGDYPIHLLTPAIVLACLRKIEKTAPDMARRIKQLISQVIKYAMPIVHLDKDVTYGLEVSLKKYKKGHFKSISVDEFGDLLMAIYNHKVRMYRQTYLAIQLMLLTFVRTSELLQAEWSEINLETAMWVIPEDRMKKDKAHLVPLSRQAVEVLAELKEINGRKKYVFPGISRLKPTMSIGTILVALKRMGYKDRMTGHGFRSLALGVLKEKLGYKHDIADRQLAHVRQSGNDRAYDRAEFITERTEMMQKYADYIDRTFLEQLVKQSSKLAC